MNLTWTEAELPQSERTKHVHSLHPYTGKFVPQLAEMLLTHYFDEGDIVYDPFVGSGTTLIEANVLNCHSIGVDISAFDVLMCQVKTRRYDLESLEEGLAEVLREAKHFGPASINLGTDWLRTWFSDNALGELLAYREVAEYMLDGDHLDVAKIILSRAARSARLVPHYDLDRAKAPVTAPYHCYKHSKECKPVGEANKFLSKYTNDTLKRITEFAPLRTDARVDVLHDTGRMLPLDADGIITSPPYCGMLEYHEQHRYSYELLGLEDRAVEELGKASDGTSKSAVESYRQGMVAVFKNATKQMFVDAPVIIVVNDAKNVYPSILAECGLVLEKTITREVGRRTGGTGSYSEDVLVTRVA